MIEIMLNRTDAKIGSILVTGHSQSADPGEDLICAGVSSIVFGALNALDELAGDDCFLSVGENRIDIIVRENSDTLQKYLGFLLIQLKTVAEEYPDYVIITEKEV